MPDTDSDIPVAATVVILRDGPDGAEVLMVERPDRGSFAGAWVFPGGKVEPEDHAGDDAGDELASARIAGARETWEETGLRVDAADLVILSRWNPPPGIALRIRTWFFVTIDPGGELMLAPDEVVAADWVRPADMLSRHATGQITLYPPTWVTLQGLAEQPDAHALIDVARLRGVEYFETVARRIADAQVLLWQGDAAYAGDDEQADAAASRHRLEIATLPWRYTRSD